MSRADIDRKFRTNVGPRWPQARTDSILGALWKLEQASDIRALLLELSI